MTSNPMRPAATSPEPACASVVTPPGPGLPESLLWVGGYLVAQVVVAALLVSILILAACDGWPFSLTRAWQLLVGASSDELQQLTVLVTGGVTLGALFLVVPAVFLRLRPSPRSTLGMGFPSGHQTVLLIGAVLPLMMLSNELYRAAGTAIQLIQEQLRELFPQLEAVSMGDTVTLFQDQAGQTPYVLLLMIAGVGPAIGEELVFRGVIGRGLVARWGLLPGVLLTSWLFAMSHGMPAHAVATLPIALFLHVAYLATGSIWAPILVHFANNALAVSLMKFELGDNAPVSWMVLVSAAVYVITMGALLWHSRPVSPVGELSTGNHPHLRNRAPGRGWLPALAGSGVLCFTASYCWSALAAL